jgi:hypothetical protein
MLQIFDLNVKIEEEKVPQAPRHVLRGWRSYGKSRKSGTRRGR